MPSVGRTRNPPRISGRRSSFRVSSSGRDVEYTYTSEWRARRAERHVAADDHPILCVESFAEAARAGRSGRSLRQLAVWLGTTQTRARELLRAGARS